MTDYGLDPQQFRLHVIRPTLQRIGLWSKDAENLVLGTCLVESRLTYVKQIKGPALGVAQMEPATHDDNWDNFLRYQPKLRADVVKIASYFSDDHPDATEMIGNLSYAVAMCRVDYRREKAPLPSDAMGLTQYHKIYYNSVKGKTDITESVKHFKFAVNSYIST